MPCVVCGNSNEATKYKCPRCGSKYCSVSCYKEHKVACSSLESKNNDPIQPRLSSQVIEVEAAQHSKFERVYRDEIIQSLLRSEGVEKHLRLIMRILEDSKLSGEQSQEGRKIVALKKIRELRKGGREANAAIEDLAVRVIQLLNSETIENM